MEIADLRLAGAPSVRLTRPAGMLSLEVPRTAPALVRLRDVVRRLESDDAVGRAVRVPGTVLLGLDDEGIPLLLRLSSPDVTHCLVAGTTGSGKTELVRAMIASLVHFQEPGDLQLALFDPLGRGLAPFSSVPHLQFPLVRDPGEMLARLGQLMDQVKRREQGRLSYPRIVVFVDELEHVLHAGGDQVAALLTQLAQKGRSAGLSLVACTRRPSAREVGALLNSTLPVRVVGRVTSADEACVATDISGSGAERLQGRGDFVLLGGGEKIRFQAAYLEDWRVEVGD